MKFSNIDFDTIIKVGNSAYFYNDIFNVNWLLGRYCNYSCSYCWDYAHTKVKDHRPIGVIKEAIDNIFSQARNRGYRSFSFSFSGGEPTLHPNFLEIVDYISTQKTMVNLTTNCSQKFSFLEKLVQKPVLLSITASFHPEFSVRETFLKKVRYLIDAGVYLQINVVLLHDNFDEMWDHAQYFYDQGITVQAKMEVEYKDNTTIEKPYMDDELDKIKNGLPKFDEKKYSFMMIDKQRKVHMVDNVERIVGLGFNRFKGWTCEAGYRSIVIHEPSGLIKRHYLCHDEPIGHIERGFMLYKEPRKCITEICGSCADCKIPKYREL